MRRTFAGIIALFVSILGITSFNAPARAQGFDSRIQEGLKLAPVELKKHGLNPALVGLGSYIVNAQGGCNDCHTNPPYAAGGEATVANIQLRCRAHNAYEAELFYGLNGMRRMGVVSERRAVYGLSPRCSTVPGDSWLHVKDPPRLWARSSS